LSSHTDAGEIRQVRTLPFHRIVPRLVRDPVRALAEIGAEAQGEIVRLNLGTFRPYLVTHPEHVQQVLRGNAANYVRDGAFWKPLDRLFGSSIMSDGALWHSSRDVLSPMFTAKRIDSLAEVISQTVADAIEDLDRRAAGTTVDATAELSLIISRTVAKIFFGDRISTEQSERLVPALNMIATSIVSRIMLPLVPDSVPLPGDRSFNEAVEAFDSVILPLLAEPTPGPDAAQDVYSVLRRASDADPGLPANWVRDNLIAIFATGSETAIMELTWLWPLLDSHPGVADKLRGEIRRVVGGDRVRPSHLPGLVYTKMVVQELLRLYPVGWMFSRMAAGHDILGGVALEPGAEVMISPYLTHRLESVWDRPLDFDPERFAPGNTRSRHRYGYFPFGGGPHQCVGMHLFTMEAQLIIAGLLSRFEPSLTSASAVTPRAAVTLRPSESVRMTLRPAGRTR
jgi:cytochrome P450